MFKDIIKALLIHKETLPTFEQWDGESKTSVCVGTFKITFKAHKSAIEKIIARYEKGNVLDNFQGKLAWAWRDTRNFSHRPLKPELAKEVCIYE